MQPVTMPLQLMRVPCTPLRMCDVECHPVLLCALATQVPGPLFPTVAMSSQLSAKLHERILRIASPRSQARLTRRALPAACLCPFAPQTAVLLCSPSPCPAALPSSPGPLIPTFGPPVQSTLPRGRSGSILTTARAASRSQHPRHQPRAPPRPPPRPLRPLSRRSSLSRPLTRL